MEAYRGGKLDCSETNARLFAAAPQLLTALEALLRDIGTPEFDILTFAEYRDMWGETEMQQAQAAVATAGATAGSARIKIRTERKEE